MDALRETVDILAELVAFPTVSSDGNRALIDRVADRLADVGAEVDLMASADGGKANLFATLGPRGVPGGIVLSGHTDVVPAMEEEWTGDPFRLREADGRLYGRGTCDMKGFIAATLALAPRFAAMALARPVHFAFTYDEEVGCLGARDLVAALAARGVRPAIAIIGEPTELRVVEGHKGCCEYTTRVFGLEGHGSDPDRGVNAVEIATAYVAELLSLREELRRRAPARSPFVPPFTTVQVGRIVGGSARNVIAGHCAIEWEMRPVQAADADFVKERLERYCENILLPRMRAVHPAAAIEVETVGEVAGLVPTERNAARDLVCALTGLNGSDVAAFGTEAGLYQSLGLAAVVCGPGSIAQAHKANEYVALDQLAGALTMLQGLEGALTRR